LRAFGAVRLAAACDRGGQARANDSFAFVAGNLRVTGNVVTLETAALEMRATAS